MRFLVYGAGAIGTYIGGSLALAGHETVFLEQPALVTTLQDAGLVLEIDGEVRRVERPQAAGSLTEALALGPFDAAIFALKSFDTQAAIEAMRQLTPPLQHQLPPFLCLQNGVENETTLAAALGSERVIAGSVTSAIGRRGLGSIVLERRRGMGLADRHPRSAQLAAALNQAQLNAHLYRNGAAMKWSKMLTNLLANATSAILDMPPAEIFAHPALYRLEVAQQRETLAVMARLGLAPVDLPGTPVRLLAFAMNRLPPSISQPLVQRAVGSGRGAKMPSFYIDLQAGRGKSEVDYLNGAVVRHGEQLGIPTPVNRRLNEILLGLTNGELARADYARRVDRLIG